MLTMRNKTLHILGYITTLFLVVFVTCEFNRRGGRLAGSNGIRDLEDIVQDGVITAVTDINSTNYFIYNGEPMGYQFDMLQAFAKHIGVKLEIIAENDLDAAFNLLERANVDIFANNLTVFGERTKRYRFTTPHSTTRQVLVQRNRSDGKLIKTTLELAGKIIYVQKGSSYAHRLRNLSEEIGKEIVIVELPNYETDELIELVANGDIDFTVCDENVAQVNAFYYTNLYVETAVSFDQSLAWAVGKKANNLYAKLNNWIEEFTKTAEYKIIKGKYFNNPYWANKVLSSNSISKGSRISPWDEGFRKASSSIDWDWRLFASLVYQESKFNHNVQSHRGAFGLMQFMPSTAEYFGVNHITDPQTQIRAGARYLKWLENRFEDISDPEQRIKFTIASYNAGIGHVIDARNLARKHGKDPNVWDNNVDFFILNKSNPDYYCDTTVKYGYFRGVETFKYVNQIMQRYKHYQNMVPQ
jgi:membrane-bound lytic murein transglycosylase F